MLASTTAVIGPLINEASSTTLYVVGSVLAVVVVLIGIGYGWRMLTRRITGGKI